MIEIHTFNNLQNVLDSNSLAQPSFHVLSFDVTRSLFGFSLSCVWVFCLLVCLITMCVQCPQRPIEGAGPLQLELRQL